MEALGSLAVLISFGSFILGIFVVVAFFIMTSNVSSIARRMHNAEYRQEEIKANLEKIVRLMLADREKEKA